MRQTTKQHLNYQTDNGEEVPKVSKEKRPDVRANKHAQKIKVTVYGWKIWLAFDPESKTTFSDEN